MTMSGYLKCEVCGKITQVKLGVSSYSMQFSIYIACKNCDTIFVGTYRQDDAKVEVKTNFINAVEVREFDGLPNYICTITREFVSDKVNDVTCAEDTISPPEWMKFNNRLGHEAANQIKTNASNSCFVAEHAIFEWQRVMNLWFNENFILLKEQLEHYLDASENNIKLENKQNYLSAIRKLTYSVTNTLFSLNEREDYIKTTREHLSVAIKSTNAIPFIKKLGDMDLFTSLEKMIYERITSFYTYINEFMPIFMLRELTEEELTYLLDAKSNKGIFTTTFDRIKPLYIDLFETSVKTLIIPIGLNNILKRGSHNSFAISTNMNLEKFQKTSASFDKMQYLEAGNPFSFGIENHLNNKLRNSIGHCSYNFSNINQVVQYDKEKKEISLLEVLWDSYEMMMYLIKIFDTITLLHEAYFEFK